MMVAPDYANPPAGEPADDGAVVHLEGEHMIGVMPMAVSASACGGSGKPCRM